MQYLVIIVFVLAHGSGKPSNGAALKPDDASNRDQNLEKLVGKILKQATTKAAEQEEVGKAATTKSAGKAATTKAAKQEEVGKAATTKSVGKAATTKAAEEEVGAILEINGSETPTGAILLGMVIAMLAVGLYAVARRSPKGLSYPLLGDQEV